MFYFKQKVPKMIALFRKRLRLSNEHKSLYLTPSNLDTNLPDTNLLSNNSGLKLRISPRKRLTPDLPSPSISLRRQSPRKHSSLSRPAGFSKLTITANSIVGEYFFLALDVYLV